MNKNKKNFCDICSACRYRCKTDDINVARKCMNQEKMSIDYVKLFRESNVNKRIFCGKYGLKYFFFKKMLYNDIPFDERYLACVEEELLHEDEFESYRKRFSNGEDESIE